MRNSILLFLLITSCLFGNAQTRPDVFIDSLIRIMTVEEKVGQMSQIDLGVIARGEPCKLKNPQEIDLEKLHLAITKYKIGSVLNVGCGSGTISIENWHKIIGLIQKENTALSRLNIPIIYGIDAVHGVNYTMGGTLFPQQIGQAATWNPDLVEQINAITAYETRASAIPWNFSPVLDLGRQPLWSRFSETYGEDVVLAKAMTKSAITGMQGEDIGSPFKVAACMKHFLGYSMPLSGKDRSPAWIAERELREYFLPTFQQAIISGAKTVMINSGEINGTPVHANYDILTKLLRNELGFKGVAITDWEDIYKLTDLHRVASNRKEAVKMAIMAGIDMSMTPNDLVFNDLLIELVKEGAVPMNRIDQAVSRILTLKKELGLFNKTQYPIATYPEFGSKQHAEISYKAACESLTLLKNNNKALPIENKKEKIFVCGPAANSLNFLNGSWTHTWQGIDTTCNTKNKLTILQALQINFGKEHITFLPGCSTDSLIDLASCLELAKKADKIILCLGEKPGTELPGNIDDLSLSPAQVKLAAALSSLHKPVILVCSFGRPRIIRDVVKGAEAVLYAYLPGDEGGRAIADCISGIVNPSGKLPFTYPGAVNELVHYDHKTMEELATDFSMNGYNPEFDFGYGLSFTSFTYSPMKINKATITGSESFEVSVTVTNNGTRTGKEVVQLYYQDLFASITPSVKKLTGFRKIELNPDESKQVTFVLTAENFSFIGKDCQRITEPGEIELQLSNQKKLIYVR